MIRTGQCFGLACENAAGQLRGILPLATTNGLLTGRLVGSLAAAGQRGPPRADVSLPLVSKPPLGRGTSWRRQLSRDQSNTTRGLREQRRGGSPCRGDNYLGDCRLGLGCLVNPDRLAQGSSIQTHERA
jgi:hypothetical protein